MPNLNKVTLIGHLGRDPEIRFLPSGDKVANFSLATTEKWNKGSEKQERTEWHKVAVFGKPAEIVESYLKKGDPVYIEGSIRYEEWNDKDGNKRNATKIEVGFGGRVLLLGGKPTDTRKRSGRAQADGDDGEEQTAKEGVTDENGDDVPF